MCWIELKGMKFHAFVGHFDEEKDVGNKFNVDLRVKTGCKKAAESDKLHDALDYQLLYGVVKDQMRKKCNLVENVAMRILNAVFKNFAEISEAEVKVTKLSPKLGGLVDEVSIIMTLSREDILPGTH